MPEKDLTHWKTKIKRVDFLGALFLMSSLLLLLLGLDRGSNTSWYSAATIIESALFQPLFAIFLLVEKNYAVEPFAPPRIMFSKTFVALIADIVESVTDILLAYYLYISAASSV